MELSPELRKAISDHCLPLSWQMLSAWRLQHLGSLHDEPDVVTDWLANVSPRSLALVEEMVRRMSERLWRIELRPASAEPTGPGLRTLDVVCGGQRWTLSMLPKPQLHVLRISR